MFDANIIKTSRVNLSELSTIEKYVSSKDDPKFFITMTEVNKIGINPKSGYATPLGVYAYPLTAEVYNQLMTYTLPFVKEKPYINLFTISQSLCNLEKYSSQDLDRDLSVLKKMYISDSMHHIADATNIPVNKNCNPNASKLWQITQDLSIFSILKWNAILRSLGYVGFNDPGMGLIHHAEPAQAVILDPSIIIPVQTFINPHKVYDTRESLFNSDLDHVDSIIAKVFSGTSSGFKVPRDPHKFYGGFKILDRIAMVAKENNMDPSKAIDEFIKNIKLYSFTFFKFDPESGTFKIKDIAKINSYFDPFSRPVNYKSKEEFRIVFGPKGFKKEKQHSFFSKFENLSPERLLEISKNTNDYSNLLEIINCKNATKEVIAAIIERAGENLIRGDAKVNLTKLLAGHDLVNEDIFLFTELIKTAKNLNDIKNISTSLREIDYEKFIMLYNAAGSEILATILNNPLTTKKVLLNIGKFINGISEEGLYNLIYNLNVTYNTNIDDEVIFNFISDATQVDDKVFFNDSLINLLNNIRQNRSEKTKNLIDSKISEYKNKILTEANSFQSISEVVKKQIINQQDLLLLINKIESAKEQPPNDLIYYILENPHSNNDLILSKLALFTDNEEYLIKIIYKNNIKKDTFLYVLDKLESLSSPEINKILKKTLIYLEKYSHNILDEQSILYILNKMKTRAIIDIIYELIYIDGSQKLVLPVLVNNYYNDQAIMHACIENISMHNSMGGDLYSKEYILDALLTLAQKTNNYQIINEIMNIEDIQSYPNFFKKLNQIISTKSSEEIETFREINSINSPTDLYHFSSDLIKSSESPNQKIIEQIQQKLLQMSLDISLADSTIGEYDININYLINNPYATRQMLTLLYKKNKDNPKHQARINYLLQKLNDSKTKIARLLSGTNIFFKIADSLLVN